MQAQPVEQVEPGALAPGVLGEDDRHIDRDLIGHTDLAIERRVLGGGERIDGRGLDQRRHPRLGRRRRRRKAAAQRLEPRPGKRGIPGRRSGQRGKAQIVPVRPRFERRRAPGGKAGERGIARHIGRTRQRRRGAGIVRPHQQRPRKVRQGVLIMPPVKGPAPGHRRRPVLPRLGPQREIIARQRHVERDGIAGGIEMMRHRQQCVRRTVARLARGQFGKIAGGRPRIGALQGRRALSQQLFAAEARRLDHLGARASGVGGQGRHGSGKDQRGQHGA